MTLLNVVFFIVAFAAISLGVLYFLIPHKPGPAPPRPPPDPSRHNLSDDWPYKSKVYLDVSAVQQYIYKSWPADNANVITAENMITDLKKKRDVVIPGLYTWAEPRSVQQSVVIFKPGTKLTDLQTHMSIGVDANIAGIMMWKDGFSQYKPADPLNWPKVHGSGLTHLQNVYKQYAGSTAANDAIQSIRDMEGQGIKLAGYYAWSDPINGRKHAITFTPGTRRVALAYRQLPGAVVSFRPGLEN